MRVIHRLMITLALSGTILSGRVTSARAQEDPPDLKMLLNLDLYGRSQPKGAGASGASASSAPSMLDQIRTLRSMGYLGGNGPKTNANAPASSAPGLNQSGNVEVTPSESNNDEGVPQ